VVVLEVVRSRRRSRLFTFSGRILLVSRTNTDSRVGIFPIDRHSGYSSSPIILNPFERLSDRTERTRIYKCANGSEAAVRYVANTRVAIIKNTRCRLAALITILANGYSLQLPPNVKLPCTSVFHLIETRSIQMHLSLGG
jgi:hypothetical protein